MTKDSDTYNHIQNYEISKETLFYPIIGSEKAKNQLFGLLGFVPKVLLINRLLSKKHDWVLGTEQMFEIPEENLAPLFKEKTYDEIKIDVRNHIRYLHEEETRVNGQGWADDVKKMLERYLQKP